MSDLTVAGVGMPVKDKAFSADQGIADASSRLPAIKDSQACNFLWLSLSPFHFIPERDEVFEDAWEIIESELSFEGTFDEGGLVQAVDARGGPAWPRVNPPAARIVLQPSTPSRPM